MSRRNRSDLQVRAGRALADHPYRLELRGRPGSLAWPGVCAYCGAPAAERIAVRKAFARPRVHGRLYGRPRPYRWHTVTSVRVPFCAGCADRHRATVERKGLVRQLLSLVLTPLLIPLAGSAVFFVITLRAVRDVPLDAPGGRLAWGLPALMAVIFVWTIFLAWANTRPSRVEAQTDVTRACDFSDDVSKFFEGERHIYAIRDRTFAEAFEAANRDCLWTASHDARSSRRSFAVAAAVGVVAVAVWLWVVLGPR